MTQANINKFILRPYQEQFIDSTARFPALIAGIGTGKTFSAIMRSVLLSNKYPGNLGLIVRKEFTDLRDSTMKDFEKYTGMKINSMKEVTFPNGSQIMFRHASEVAVLKNINLGWFYIEQAEEFDTDEQFTYLRDRLRRGGAVEYRCGFLIANANGHNWIYKNWVNNPKPEYHCIQATTFENSVNLAPDFIEDLKRMETDAPSHYRQYVLNDHNEQDIGDVLFGTKIIEQSINNRLTGINNGKIIVGVDVARFGDDRTVFSGIQYLGGMNWKQIFKKSYHGSDLMQTAGRLMDLIYEIRPFSLVIDDIGVGGGLVDRIIELNPKNVNIVRYMANGEIVSNNKIRFVMKRDEDYFKLREMIERNNLQLLNDEEQTNDLNSIRFTYKNGKKTILSKKDLKKLGYRSPDTADALQMAVSDISSVYFSDSINENGNRFDGYQEINREETQLSEVRIY